MSTRNIKDAKDLSTDELIYFKGHAKATYMSNGQTVEDAINAINSTEGGIAFETDPIFSASPAASITDNKITEWNNKQDTISDLDVIRSGAEKGATALQSIPSEYVTESQLVWVKAEGEAGVRLKGTNGTATGNMAISAGDDKTASDGTAFASVASGDHAVAFGYGNTCAGRTTLAQGLYNTINGKDAVAFGQRNLVNGDQAFSAGQQNEVTARLGVAIGYKNKATNTDSIAIGYQNTSSGSASVAMGDTCEAIGTSSTAMGYKTKATGAYTSTFGQNTQATNDGEVAMGLYNKSTTSTEASEQTLFSFGIGTSDTDRVNAFEIKKNGDVYIGDKILSGDGITVETDPVFSASPAASITNDKISTWDGKQDVITDLNTIRQNADDGESAYRAILDGDVLLSDDVAKVATSGSYNDLIDTPTIPNAVTESIVSEWGFTKNTGTYNKPDNGIPKNDLANDVQASLDKADTALQSYTEQYKGTVTGVKINGTTKEPLDGIVDLGSVITEHQDISGKADSSSLSAIATTGDYNDLQNKPVIPASVSELANDSNFATESFVTNKIAEAELSEKEVDLSGYATKDDLKTLATKDEIPSLSGYATEIWVGTQGFLTASDIADKQNTITDLETIRSGAALGATALQEVPSEYITEGELNDKGYLTKHQDISHLATKAELPTVPTKVSELENDSNFITLSDIPEVSVPTKTSDLTNDSGFITINDIPEVTVPTKVSDLENDSKFITIDEVPEVTVPTKTSELTNDSGFITIDDVPVLEIPDEYITASELKTINGESIIGSGNIVIESGGTHGQDLSQYATKNWVESQGYAHQEDLLEISFNDIQDSPISIDDSGMINFVDESGNVGFQINEEGLRVTDVIAGEHKLSQKANASDIPSLDGYAKTSDIPSVDGLVKSEDLPNFNEFAKTEDIPSLDGYAKTTDIPSLDGYASKEWVNNKNYATEDDLSNIDYSSIKNVPISEDETGELNIADESGNIGFKINSEGLFAKDVIAGDHVLSNKIDINNVKTINGQSILGSGNIIVGSGESAIYVLELSGLESGTISQEQYDSVLNATLVNIKFAGVYECISTTKVNTDGGIYLSTQIGESSVTIILNSDLTYTSNQSSNSDWNSEEGDPGYIANRTHYLSGVMKLENSGDTVEVYTSDAGVYMNGYMYPNYRTLKDGESINFGVGCILSRVGNYVTLSDPEGFMDRPVYVSHAVEQLSEIFIPDNIARKKGIIELIPESGNEFRINKMNPDTIYICTESMFNINIESFNNKDIVNEYKLHFISSSNSSLSFSDSILWSNGIVPELEDNTYYELTITSTRFINRYVYKAELIQFK